ncbi:MAG: protease pro-enzyme activation domain-containing protein, partial [Candidatus Binataceae bacterium]
MALAILACGRVGAQSSQVQARITDAVDVNDLVTLKGNTHQLARPEFDRGPAPSDLALNRMLLILTRSPEQEAALKTLLDQQQDKSSPNYHHWLTPQQFGQQFGPADSDIAEVTAWLGSYGFHDVHVANGRVAIEFSGSASQVQSAFHTSIHKFVVDGAEHWANASDPQIPAALAPVVAGVFTLHDFYKAPQIQVADEKFTATVAPGGRPQFTAGSGMHALVPADYWKIYNFGASPPDTFAVIAIVARSNINTEDVLAFHDFTFDQAFVPQVIVNGPDPGDLGGNEEAEAVLDSTWSAAAAPAAGLFLV